MLPDVSLLEAASEGFARYMEILPAALDRELRKGDNAALLELDADYKTAGDIAQPPDPCKAFAVTLFDGFATLAKGVSAVTYALLANEASHDRVKADPSLVTSAFMEGFRLHGTASIALRAAACDFDFNGVAIPKGTALMPLLLIANRDPDVFEEPDVYKLERKSRSKQTSFGGGLYACPGRHLVTMFCETALAALTHQSVNIALTGDATWLRASHFHELGSMPVIISRP